VIPAPLGLMHPHQKKCSCCCITTIIFSIVGVTALIIGGLYLGGYIFAPENPDAIRATSFKSAKDMVNAVVTSAKAHNAKRAKLTCGKKKWKIHRPDPKPAKSFYTGTAHFDPEQQKKAAPGIIVALPNKQAGKGQPAKKEWWFCSAKTSIRSSTRDNMSCHELYESDNFDRKKIAKRQKKIENLYGNSWRRQKLCLACTHTNDTHRDKGLGGEDIDVEDSDDCGRTGTKKREAAIMELLKDGVTDLKITS